MSQDGFHRILDRFADLQILRYQVPGFEDLPLARKKLLYYLYQASLCGRDIIWDQNYANNLSIRRFLETIVRHYPGEKDTDLWNRFMTYVKRVWFSNGIHHHYAYAKFTPDMDKAEMATLAEQCAEHLTGMDQKDLLNRIFDKNLDVKKVNKDKNLDRASASAVNYYQDVSEDEIEAFYAPLKENDDPTPISHGLNSTLVKRNGQITEDVWKVGGRYSAAIEPMVHWLKKAAEAAENPTQAAVIQKLARYYETGDLADFDAYSVAWVKDVDSEVDLIHGFIETYNDPLGYRGTFEAILSIKDPIATKRMETIANHAQWFEDHSPIDPAHKREKVTGVTGAVINVVVESGDSSPSTPIGVNLPNADWIRAQHGSKSVNLANIVSAYNQSSGKLQEAFIYSEEELARHKKYGHLADDLHTDLHEVIGHGSGKLAPGTATPKQTLKHYASTLEEARADLVALYYLLDPCLVELGLAPSEDAGKVACDDFIRNGLMVQLRRIELGDDLEEDHMRNRQLIAAWAYEAGKEDGVIARKIRDGKTYFVIQDYQALRKQFGIMLREVQRIKSEGDFEAGQSLVERYGVRIDAEIHQEVLERVKELDLASYSGFVNPKLVPVYRGDDMVDVSIHYTDDFTDQMLSYSTEYGFL